MILFDGVRFGHTYHSAKRAEFRKPEIYITRVVPETVFRGLTRGCCAMGISRIPGYDSHTPHVQLHSRGRACLPGRTQAKQQTAAFLPETPLSETVVENGIRTRVPRWAEHFRRAGKMTVRWGMRDEGVTRNEW